MRRVCAMSQWTFLQAGAEVSPVDDGRKDVSEPSMRWTVSLVLGGAAVVAGLVQPGWAQAPAPPSASALANPWTQSGTSGPSSQAAAAPPRLFGGGSVIPPQGVAPPQGGNYMPGLSGWSRPAESSPEAVDSFTDRVGMPAVGTAPRPWSVPVNYYQVQDNAAAQSGLTAPGTNSAVVPPAPAPPVDGAGTAIPPAYDNPTKTTEAKTEEKKEGPKKEEAKKDEKPKYPTVRVTGVFQLDFANFDQDFTNRLTVGNVQNGYSFRRARLAATGNVTEDTTYMMEFDFAQSQAWFVDVWMNFAKVPVFGNVRVGRFRQPFGMSELTSVRELPFLERPTTFAFAPFRQTGVMAYDHNEEETATYAVSAYRYLSDNFGNVYGDDGGWGAATRLTYLPYISCDANELIHVGFDYSYNDAARNVVQYSSQPEIFVGQNPGLGPAGLDKLPIVSVPPFVNTGPMPFQHSNLYNIEAAAKYGALVVQSEMRWAYSDMLTGPNNTFPAFYAHARYVLTGETIPYVRQGAVFGRVVPDNPVRFGGCGCTGWGAWELAGRVSYIDLNGVGLPGPGRRMTDTTVGLNWYLNRYTKFQFNWIHAFLNDPVLLGSNANVFALRSQIDF